MEEADNPFPFEKDGSLDLRVVPPEVTLSESEMGDVIRLMKVALLTYADPLPERREAASRPYWPDLGESAPLPSPQYKAHRPRMRCGFDPHHVLVLFDATERPIGKIFVCFDCGEIVSAPRAPEFGGTEPGGMSDEEKVALRRIFDAHGLGAWAHGETAELKALAEYEQRIYGTPEEPTFAGVERMTKRSARPSGAPPNVTPSRASPRDRERLCVWLREAMYARNRETHFAVVGAFECSAGPKYRFALDEDRQCEAGNLCDVPMGQIEACLRGSVLSGVEKVCSASLPSECAGLMHCLPYLAWFDQPVRPAGDQ